MSKLKKNYMESDTELLTIGAISVSPGFSPQ